MSRVFVANGCVLESVGGRTGCLLCTNGGGEGLLLVVCQLHLGDAPHAANGLPAFLLIIPQRSLSPWPDLQQSLTVWVSFGR